MILRPRLIVTDIDGTLLESGQAMGALTLGVLERCRERGILLTFATGRPLRRTPDIRKALPWDAVAHHNGGVVHAGDELISATRIPLAIARELATRLSGMFPDENTTLETADALFADRAIRLPFDHIVLSNFMSSPESDADKIIVSMNAPGVYEKVCAVLPPELYAEISDGKLILIMHRGATKEHAVRAIAARFGVNMRDVVAFGDDLNDAVMLRACGMGVAMGNALDSVKAVADYGCADCKQDGMAHFLLEHVLGES